MTTDQNHLSAIKIRDKLIIGIYGEAYITDYIFDETVTVALQKTKKILKAIEVGNKLRKSLPIIPMEKTHFIDAWEIFRNQKNTRLSFTDCTILAVMEYKKIQQLATFDKDFIKIKNITVIS